MTATAIDAQIKRFSLPSALKASRRSIESYAEKAAEILGFEPGGDLEAVVRKVGGRIHHKWLSLRETCPGWEIPSGIPDIATEHHSGVVLVKGHQDFDIFLSPFTGELRDRFTIAHELGHYFLHSKQGSTQIAAARLDSDRPEWEANWFAAAFLMPESKVRDAWNRFGKNSFLCAASFLVSTEAFEVRKKSLGLD